MAQAHARLGILCDREVHAVVKLMAGFSDSFGFLNSANLRDAPGANANFVALNNCSRVVDDEAVADHRMAAVGFFRLMCARC